MLEKCPCYGCNERHKACHDTCEEFKAHKLRREKLKEEDKLRTISATHKNRGFVKKSKIPKYKVKNYSNSDY